MEVKSRKRVIFMIQSKRTIDVMILYVEKMMNFLNYPKGLS